MDLPECKPDALETRSSLVGSMLWGSSVASMPTFTDLQATKAVVREAIMSQAGTYGPQDLFLLFFSSHGTNDGTKGYLIPYDGENINSFISGEELKSWLTALRKPGQMTHILVIIDACFSGLFIGKSPNGTTSKFVPIPGSSFKFKGKDPVKQLQEMPDTVVITASAGNETSLTVTELGHSLCTYYLTKGLGQGGTIGPADLNHDGKITMFELYSYANPLVVDYASRALNNQHLQLYGTEVFIKY